MSMNNDLDIINPGNLTVPNTKFKKLFGKYTKFYYNNLQKIYKTDISFFSLAPEEYRNYYFRVMKNDLEWFRGIVPGIHNNGIFSTCMGSNCCKTVSDMIVAGDFRIESENPNWKKYLEDFLIATHFRRKLKRIQPIKEALGTSLAIIDIEEEFWDINFVAANKFFCETDESGRITALRRLIKIQTMLSMDDSSFFLVEDRYLKNGKCYNRYKIYQGSLSATYTSTLSEVKNPSKQLLTELKDKLKNRRIGEIRELPFKNSVGAVIIHASKTCSGFEDMPQFSDGLLEDAKQYLLEYDETFTSKQKDRVMSDKGVLVPRSMTPGDIGVHFGYEAFKTATLEGDGLSDNIYERIPSINADKQTPFFFQSDYRQEQYNADLDKCRQRIADAIKIDSSDLGSHSETGGGYGYKTATEVSALNGISKTTIEEKRSMITDAIEELFRIILNYVFDDKKAKASMVFNTSQSSDPESETRDILSQVNGGILSKKTAMKRKNPNYSEEEIQKELEQISQERKEEQELQQASFGMNDYGLDEQIDEFNDGEVADESNELEEFN